MKTFYVTGVGSTDVSMKIELEDHEVDDIHPDTIVEKLTDKFYELSPGGLCIHCSGYSAEWSRDMSDEYDMVISDSDYKTVFEDDKLKGSFLKYVEEMGDENETDSGSDSSISI